MDIELTDREVELIQQALLQRYQHWMDGADVWRPQGKHASFEKNAAEHDSLFTRIATHKGT